MSNASCIDSSLPTEGRFVLLWHELPEHFDRRSHYDLMLESGKTLKTWEIFEFPNVGTLLRAKRLADHRIEYLNYQGPISGGRGYVSRMDAGTYVVRGTQPPTEIELAGCKTVISLRFSPFLDDPHCEIQCLAVSGSLDSDDPVPPCRS